LTDQTILSLQPSAAVCRLHVYPTTKTICPLQQQQPFIFLSFYIFHFSRKLLWRQSKIISILTFQFKKKTVQYIWLSEIHWLRCNWNVNILCLVWWNDGKSAIGRTSTRSFLQQTKQHISESQLEHQNFVFFKNANSVMVTAQRSIWWGPGLLPGGKADRTWSWPLSSI